MGISYYDFTNLPNQQTQYDLVINHGRVLNERTVDQLKYVLYEVSCFSVEVIFNTVNNRISGINIFQQKAAYSF